MTAALTSVLADADGWDHMSWAGGWWMVVWGTLMMVGLIVLMVWLIRTTAGKGDGNGSAALDSARQILAERYARGELTTDQYRERIGQLGWPDRRGRRERRTGPRGSSAGGGRRPR